MKPVVVVGDAVPNPNPLTGVEVAQILVVGDTRRSKAFWCALDVRALMPLTWALIGQAVLVDDWESWLTGLDESRQRFAMKLRDRFAALGCDDPEGWTRSEIDEDIAQLTRFLFLRATWKRMTEIRDSAMRSDVARRLVADGTDPDRLQRVVQVAIGQLAFDMLFLLDDPVGSWWSDGYEDVGPYDARWRLMETVSEDGTLTGRDVGGLHESWSATDPGREEGSGWC